MSDKNTVLSFENVCFSYKDGGRKLDVLKNANVEFKEGTFYAVVGPSGSGKTTTLALAGGLDTPQSGKVIYTGKDIKKFGLTKFRRFAVAMVFQNYNLISYMTALENVEMAMEINKNNVKNRRQEAIEILKKLGLTEEESKRNVRHLSGGQQQRVAVARAIASRAPIILADEPTGNLDAVTAADIVKLFKELAADYGKCVIVVTHSDDVSKCADEVFRFGSGTLQKAS